MIEHDGYLWIPILPVEMRARLKELPKDKSRWPKDFRDRYKALHGEFTAAKTEFVKFARRDRDRRMSPRAANALAYLADCLNFETGRCDPSQQTIADEIACDVSTVERALRRLVDAGWLATYRRGATSTNFYQLRVVKAKFEAISEDSEARRDIRKLARRKKSEPAKMPDHSAKHPAKMPDHDPAFLPDHDPAKMRDKPMKGTSEGEPLNENIIAVAEDILSTTEDILSSKSADTAKILHLKPPSDGRPTKIVALAAYRQGGTKQ